MTREEIAEILKTSRTSAGLTQKQAAAAIGRKQQTLASWETAQSQPDANTLFLLCGIYGISIDDTFGFTKKKDATLASKPEINFMKRYRELNDEGQDKLSDYLDDLISSGKYKKCNFDGNVGKKEA